MNTRLLAEPKKTSPSAAWASTRPARAARSLAPEDWTAGVAAQHDFSRLAIHALPAPETPAFGRTADCPLYASPQACPLGGACHECPARVQTKLVASQPGDAHEQEAERIADQVMRLADGPMRVQRKCARCEEEDDEALQPHAEAGRNSGGELGQASSALVREALQSPGAPLASAARATLEPVLGHDFSRVRVHTDAKAAESARAVNALAYTVGWDVAFAAGRYQPASRDGQRLLAHELAHVVQQTGAGERLDRNGGGTTASTAPRAPTTDEQTIIDAARLGGFVRCQRAYERTAGIGPPPPPGRYDPAEVWQREARRLARIMFEWDNPNMEQVAEIVGNMRGFLTPGLQVMVAQSNDPDCGNRAGYVRNLRQPIVLCPEFFNSDTEQQIRTMIHESAHLARVASSDNSESYCVLFDCVTSCGGFNSADSWAHYIHCLSGQTPDEPETVEGSAP